MTFDNLKEKFSFLNTLVAVAPICIDGAENYQDSRSAVFYGMGQAIKEKRTVGVFVSGAYLSSAYTALTEAWFQKANVIVVAFYDKVSEVKTAWADRCVLKNITVDISEISEHTDILRDCCNLNGPVLINIVGIKMVDNPVDYSNWVNAIHNIDKDKKIVCYNSTENTGVINVISKDKYGIISKYIGMSVAMDAGVLLCTSDCFLLDANVFRTRYANSNMKIVFLDNGKLEELDAEKWFESNGWKFRVVGGTEYGIVKWLLAQKQQAVLIVR